MSTGTALGPIFCTSCGTRLAPGNRFCGACGTTVAVLANTAPAGAATPVPAAARPVHSAANFPGLSSYYRDEFATIESSSERYQGKWNWAAFCFGALWALSKGLWVPALIAFVGSLFTGGLVGVIYWIIFAMRGNYMYYRKIARNENPAY